MQTLSISKRRNLALNILQRIQKPLTVQHIRDTWETEEVDHLIGKIDTCTSFEFNDLNYKPGYLSIEYNVVYSDGYKTRVYARVRLDMSLKECAEVVIEAIRDASYC